MEVCDTTTVNSVNIVQQFQHITMQNEMLAVEEPMKIEVGEFKIKTETAEVESELFGIEQTGEPTFEYVNINDTVVNRIKKEQVVKDWKNDLEMQDIKVKLEEDVNYEELKFESEELVIKDENDDLNNDNGIIDVNRSLEMTIMQNQHLKTKDQWACTHCNTALKHKLNLDDHIVKMHPDLIASSKTADSYKSSICAHCNATFKRKRSLDDHTLRKHPDSIGSISTKIYECMHCAYKTVMKANLDHHMLKHPETADTSKFSTCIHCNATLKSKRALDDHTLRKHPDSKESISTKIHECTHCAFKTVRRHTLALHMLEHPETADSYKLSVCAHCNATFKSKRSLDDHTVRKHPDSIGSISTKIYECMHCAYKTVKRADFDYHNMSRHPETADTSNLGEHKIHRCAYCTYQTIFKSKFARHMLKHPQTADSYKFSTCAHCDATFKSKKTLDGHILRKHPDAIESISSKVYECMHCAYKTVKKANLDYHMLRHSETADTSKFSMCVQCNATFKNKRALDEHTLRKHPDSIGSISTKIYECMHCAYKTVMKASLDCHNLSKHPETGDISKFSMCIHCNATFKRKRSLDDHTVRKHPDSIGSISNKTYECTHCTFKTVRKADFARHILKHPETADTSKFSTCIHCNATFKRKQSLDDHMLRKHPDSNASISSKVYECMHCAYKTVKKANFDYHMSKHPETADTSKFST